MTVLERELEEPRVLREDELCHAAAGPASKVTYCGLVLDEGPCCRPFEGHPPCGRPRCPECTAARGLPW